MTREQNPDPASIPAREIVRVSDGPPVIDPHDSCEHCGAVIPIGIRVKLVEFTGDRIEQWCTYCTTHVTDATTVDESGDSPHQ